MRRRFLALFLGLCFYSQAQPRPAAPSKPSVAPAPKLVLAIVVDQFRYDYLTRFRADFTGGLKRLLEQGAVFTNANYDASPTVTAVGHSTFLSGATARAERHRQQHLVGSRAREDRDQRFRR